MVILTEAQRRANSSHSTAVRSARQRPIGNDCADYFPSKTVVISMAMDLQDNSEAFRCLVICDSSTGRAAWFGQAKSVFPMPFPKS